MEHRAGGGGNGLLFFRVRLWSNGALILFDSLGVGVFKGWLRVTLTSLICSVKSCRDVCEGEKRV